MTTVLSFTLLFVGAGALLLLAAMVFGKFIRPNRPDPDKQDIYECGEVTVGSSFVQFDLRFYVVALLFVIFDVEVALFFPWASVFGKATQLGQSDARLPEARRADLTRRLAPPAADPSKAAELIEPQVGRRLAVLAIVDLAVFFGILLVGFAYVWRRGDLDWVRGALRRPPPAIVDQQPGSAS